MIAAVPILVVGSLSLVQVNRAFSERTGEYLDEAAHSYGEVVYERLLLASELVRQTALTAGTVRDHPSAQLDSVEIADREGPTDIARQTLLVDASATPTRVFILRRVGDDRTAIGRVTLNYLWGDPEDLPYGLDFCVLADGVDRPIFCSQPLPEEQRRSIQDAPGVTGSVQWQAAGSSRTSAWWELFTTSVFDGPLLRFVATQPDAVALEPWNAFKALYAPALLLAIGVVLIAAAFHVRRTLQPIKALLAATERISTGDLEARAAVTRTDEFGDLARATNVMAAGLGRQFSTLQTLGRIDAQILGGAGIGHVVEQVLAHLLQAVPCRAILIALSERDAPEAVTSYLIAPGMDRIETGRVVLPLDALEDLREHRAGKSVADPASDAVCASLTAVGSTSALVLPLHTRARIAGFLAVGLDAGTTLNDAQLQVICDFVGRLAVALEAIQREAELMRRAYFDELTGLPNRQLLLDRLEQALIQAGHAEEGVLVMFLDLDRFKSVNDSFGHAAGDGLIRQAAHRLRDTVGPAVTVARLGGDEFVVVLAHLASQSQGGLATIDRLLATLAKPYRVGTSEVFLSASVGIASFPADGRSADELLRKADTAMYGAKDAGRGQALFYSSDMGRRVREKLEIETQLRRALEREEFRIAFQPLFSLRSGRLVAAEALLRWSHPERGPVSPVEFIPIAEETGYITILGAWTMFQACAQFGRWQRAGVPLAQLGVNVSVRQFRQAGFAAQVEDCLSRAGVAPGALVLELTETMLMRDLPSARLVIGQLKEIGVQIAIDDFGTGYSSLGYLKQLVFDQVKIDRAFIKDLPDDREGNAIVNAVVAMSHTLGKAVIAEGIESERQLAHLKAAGVDHGQGFLLGRPVFAEDFQRQFAWPESSKAEGTSIG